MRSAPPLLRIGKVARVVEKLRETGTGHPSSAFITSGNGGEYRKTAHRFAPGYGVVLDSPTAVQDSPMQVAKYTDLLVLECRCC